MLADMPSGRSLRGPAVVDSVPAPLYRAAIISQQVSAIGFNCSRRMDEFCETLLPCASQRNV